MSDEHDEGMAQAGPDTRPQWLAAKIVSSLRMKEETVAALLASETIG